MIGAEMIVNEARSWVGTPFHANAAVKGVGVDCLALVIAVFANCGCEMPERGRDSIRGDLYKKAMKVCRERYKAIKKPEPGAIILMRTSRIFNHFGIATDRGVIHACSGSSLNGVIEQPIPEFGPDYEATCFWHPEVAHWQL